MRHIFGLLLVVLVVSGCTTRAQPMVVQLPHDPQAVRTWWLVRGKSGDDSIVFCDTALLAARGQLCIAWQPAPVAP